jgi:hypothetical protein
MKKLLVVCLGIVLFHAVALGAAESFALADRVGELNERSFFLFATSAGQYIVRHDGMGEFQSPKGMRRVFTLKLGAKSRIDRIYYLEHDGDLFLFYGVHDGSSKSAYLVRMEQTKRKPRWIVSIVNPGAAVPAIQGDVVVLDTIQISKTDGHLKQD